MMIYAKTKRRAISPIIATVLIIAVTLIAAVAIGGFVFGLFGSSTNTAQVSVVNAALIHDSAAAAAITVTCASASGGTYGFVQLSNTGTASTTVTAVSLTYGGSTFAAGTLTSCGATSPVNAGGTLFLQFSVGLGTPAPASGAPAVGQQYSGFVVTGNGAQIVFTGTFS